jgi:hypothetical protein
MHTRVQVPDPAMVAQGVLHLRDRIAETYGTANLSKKERGQAQVRAVGSGAARIRVLGNTDTVCG